MTSGSGFNNTDILAQSAGQKVVEACTRNEFDTAMRIARQASEQGVGLNIEAEMWGNTPVALAASYGHAAALEMFISLGGKHWKADRLCCHVSLLVEWRPSDARYRNGLTPLMWAARNAHLQCVNLLLLLGAATHTRDSENHSALDWAKIKKHKEIAQVLEAAMKQSTQSTSASSPKVFNSSSASAAAENHTRQCATSGVQSPGSEAYSSEFVQFKDRLDRRIMHMQNASTAARGDDAT